MTQRLYDDIIHVIKENPWLLALLILYIIGFIYLAIKNNF